MLDIAGIIAAVALHLIFVHGPGNQRIGLNVDEISSIREPRDSEGHFSSDISCVVFMTNGKWVGVTETCEDVLTKIEHSGK